MTIEYQLDDKTHTMEVSISGHFNFYLSEDFHRLANTTNKIEKIILDLENTVSIDSAGLGILFFLRKKFDMDSVDLQITNSNPNVLRLLDTAKIGHFYTIR
ncbi:MAG: STAS domain-containing protein [Psychrosphaera sp.]|nr:STAS domain-containing protein [Psychrosphaera sp.]